MMAGHRIGWIGLGRMGVPMVELLLKAGHKLELWNRTRAKAEPFAAKATVVDRPIDLAPVDILFTMMATGKDLHEVYFGKDGVVSGKTCPRILVDCSSIGVDESSVLRAKLAALG